MPDNGKKQQEIDIVEALRRVWRYRKFVAKVAGTALIAGAMLALFGEVRYTARAVMVPQTGKSSSGGNLQGLAAMAGINLSAAEQGELLPPAIYPMVVASVPFRKELLRTPITVSGAEGEVTLLDYFTVRGYRGFSLFPFLRELPGRILHRGDNFPEPAADGPLPPGVESLSARENRGAEHLKRLLSVSLNEKDGYVTLSATMPEALAAACVAARAQELLQEYVTRFKVQKVQADLDFVEARYREVKADFEEKQRALARFRDANVDISSAVARTRESSLSNEYNLAFSLYSELARQLEQASLKVKEDTPTFTVVEPVTVPIEKSAPKRARILIVSLLLGLLLGAGLVFVLPLKPVEE